MLPGPRLVGFLLLLTVACGGGSDSSGSSGTTRAPATAPTAPAAAGTDVPDVTVRDVGTGADVNLRSLALADRPTLYWFWAPH